MLIFAISLLLTAGAALALLVIVGMVAGNRRAIAAALGGSGTFAGRRSDAGEPPRRIGAPLCVGQPRRNRGARDARTGLFSSLRAAA